jgi:hypothetical protein
MMLLWILLTFALIVAALFLAPRKKDIPIPPEELERRKIIQHQLFLKEEKDTRRYFEDIRSLYPV